MKIYNLLTVLTASTFAVATMLPLVVLAKPSEPAQNEFGVLTLADAQQVAAKITVKINGGRGAGSGVLLAKKDRTYLVLTNARLLKEKTEITITTPDRRSHIAKKVKNMPVGSMDMALLQFSSPQTYTLANFDNFKTGNAVLRAGREVFAAGFVGNTPELQLRLGEITQLPLTTFRNGTQIGYITNGDIQQGMEGGPILDSFGNLVGINTITANAPTNNYTLADGQASPPDQISEYRQANWAIPIYNVLTKIDQNILSEYQQLPRLHVATTPTGYMAQLDRQARLLTVQITDNGNMSASGVIIAKEGNSYSVLTAGHVVRNSYRLKITTPDQRIHQISPGDIKTFTGTDLAVMKFTSSQPYQVATLGNYRILDKSIALVGGWSAPMYMNSQQSQWQLNPGLISSQDRGEFRTQGKFSFSNGYDLIYSSLTYAGMGGSPVFDSAGRLIGIHGRLEAINGIVSGNSLGISIKSLLSLADRLNINTRSLKMATTAPASLGQEQLASINLVRNNLATPNNHGDAMGWINYGNQLYRIEKYLEATKAFDRAISLQPNLIAAYYGKGLALRNNGNYQEALSAFDRAIQLIPAKDQYRYYPLWKYRSLSLADLGKYSEALVAISQAISLEPKDIILLNEKANLLSKMRQYPEAVKIYDEIINREQKSWAYLERGQVKNNLGDKKGAVSDFDRAISINPQEAEAYSSRGVTKYYLGDKKGALKDLKMAAQLFKAQNNSESYNQVIALIREFYTP
jgi:tetratricopeptide (TPR) repeat protein/S1-C subfamily serine protease